MMTADYPIISVQIAISCLRVGSCSRSSMQAALVHLKIALGHANKSARGSRTHKSILRMMNWLRADLAKRQTVTA